MARLAERIDCQGKFDTFWGYASDLTPKNKQPLSSYITIEDVFQVLRLRYPLKSLVQVMANDAIVIAYFGLEVIETARYMEAVNENPDEAEDTLSAFFPRFMDIMSTKKQ